ncbi:PHP domain-containing protein [Stetteria hydrogenophila]
MAWRVETHLHTTASDGSMTPGEAVRLARARGLHALAVTDHDTLAGIPQALSEARSLGVTLIPGVEVTTRLGHVLALCASTPSTPPPARPGVWELAEWAAREACILIPAHPYDTRRKGVGGRALRAHARAWAAVEAWNARAPIPANILASRAAGQLGLPGTSGSDAHVPREVGLAHIKLHEEPASAEAVVEAIRRGRFKATRGIPGILAMLQAVKWRLRRRAAKQ